MPSLTSTGNVNLTSATNWSPALVPADGDNLTLGAGHTLTLDKDISLVNLTFNGSSSSRVVKSGVDRVLTVTNQIMFNGLAGSISDAANDNEFLFQITSGSLTVTGRHRIPAFNGNVNIYAVNSGATLNLYAINDSSVLVDRTNETGSNFHVTFVRATSATLNTRGLISYAPYYGTQGEAQALFRLISGVTWTHTHTGTSLWNGAQQLCRVDNSSTLSITGNFTYTSTLSSVRWWNLRGANVNATFSGNHLQSGTVITFGNTIYMDASGSSSLNLIGLFTTVLDNTQTRPFGCIGIGSGSLVYTNQSIVVPANQFLVISGNTAINISGLQVTTYGKVSIGGLAPYTVDSNTRITVMPGGQAIATPVANIPVIVPPDPAPTLPPVNNVTKDVVYGYTASPLTGTGLIVDPDILMNAIKAGLQPTAPIAVERSIDDEKSITFSWPVSGATITGEKSIDNGAYSAVAGGISFLRTESGRHYYTLAYHASDRVNEESTIRYKMTDGTYTRYFNLRLVPPGITPQQIDDQLASDFNTLNTNLAAVGLAVVGRPTLSQIEASTVLAKESNATNNKTEVLNAVGNIEVDNAAIAQAVETQLSDDFQEVIDAIDSIEVNPIIQVSPYQTVDLSTQVQGTTIRTWLGSKATVGPFAVFDNDGDPVTLNGTYEIVVSKGYRDDIKIIPHGNISIVGNQYSFSVDGATGIVGSHSWAFKLVSTNDPITQGQFIVRQVANKDTL